MLTTDGPIPHVMMRPSRHLTASRMQPGNPVVMSAMGQKQTSRHVRVMSVIPLKADIRQRGLRVRFVPRADINHHLFSAVVIALIRLVQFGGTVEIRPSTPLAWLATVSSCFGYLISQVALWLVISAARPPTVS